jgi:hypothetical protein
MTTSTFTRAEKLRVVLIGLIVPMVIAAIGAFVLLTATDLPDPIAVHWGLAGEPDRFGSVSENAVIIASVSSGIAILSTLVAILLSPKQGRSYLPRVLISLSVWLSAFLTVGIGGTVLMQRGLADATTSASPTLPLLMGFVVSLALATGAWFATPLAAIAPSSVPAGPAFELGADERVLWLRAATPAAHVVVIVAVAALVGIAAAIVGLIAGDGTTLLFVLIPVVVVLIAASTLFWRVRIDGAGVSARSALGVPRIAYPVAQVSSARAVDVVPLREFGGWGIRVGTNGRFGVVLRRGEALEIALADGRIFVITVGDATAAASLINGLVQRSASAR